MSTWSSRAAKRHPKRKTHTIRVGMPHISHATGGLAVFTAAFALIAITVQSVTTIIVALVSLAALIVSAVAGDRLAVTHRRASTERKASPGGKTKPRSTPRSAGTRKRPKCSVRCQKSKKPASTCNCSCGGRNHGPQRAAAAKVTKTQLNSPVMKKQAAARKKATP
jgi:hypothetical protein